MLLLTHQAKTLFRLPPSNRSAYLNGYTPFELNWGYHQYVSYKKDIDSRFRSDIANLFPPDHWVTCMDLAID